jgi:hypothetical protein
MGVKKCDPVIHSETMAEREEDFKRGRQRELEIARSRSGRARYCRCLIGRFCGLSRRGIEPQQQYTIFELRPAFSAR